VFADASERIRVTNETKRYRSVVMMTTRHDEATDSTAESTVKARSRTKLLAAATELLVEGGPQRVTVDAVAERSGVAKSTLYRHWRSVDELLIAVMRANTPEPAVPDLAAGFDVALRSWMHSAVVALTAPNWPRILSALLELRTKSPELAAVLEGDFDDKLTTMRAILDVGVAEGRVPAGLDARIVTQTLVGPLVLAALSGDGSDAAALADYVMERFLASYRR
jgi:AcrR family transcriptional regulator